MDPIALAVIFGLKPLAQIEAAFSAELDQVLTRHFLARPEAPAKPD